MGLRTSPTFQRSGSNYNDTINCPTLILRILQSGKSTETYYVITKIQGFYYLNTLYWLCFGFTKQIIYNFLNRKLKKHLKIKELFKFFNL